MFDGFFLGSLELRLEGDGSMKKIMLLLIAILVIVHLSSPPVLAAPRSYESRTVVIMRIIYHQIFGLGACDYQSRDFVQIIIDDSGGPTLQGDADHYGGGKTDDKLGDDGFNDLNAGVDTDAVNNIRFGLTQ